MAVAAFSKKTLGGVGAGVVLLGVGLVGRQWWLIAVVGLAVGTVGFWKLRKIHHQYCRVPPPHAPRRADVTDVTSATLGHYYVHADGAHLQAVAAGVYGQPPFDDHGIPLVDYGPGIGRQHNACTTAQCALESWELFLQTGAADQRANFLKLAAWLRRDQDAGRWFYRFENKPRALSNPWISAMAQGQGISVMARAWQCTGDDAYRAAADQAFAVLATPLEDGGVCCRTPAGTWLEEYPTRPDPPHVLNGHIWALFGVWDWYRATHRPAAQRLFAEGVAVLTANLHRFDTGYWVVYDLRPASFLVDGYYMNFQIAQLRALHAITGEVLLLEYATRWEQYQHRFSSGSRVVLESLRARLRS